MVLFYKQYTECPIETNTTQIEISCLCRTVFISLYYEEWDSFFRCQGSPSLSMYRQVGFSFVHYFAEAVQLNSFWNMLEELAYLCDNQLFSRFQNRETPENSKFCAAWVA